MAHKHKKHYNHVHHGNCPICYRTYGSKNTISHHHVLPRRYFGGIGAREELCCLCHRELERIIMKIEREAPSPQLTESEYKQIWCEFKQSKESGYQRVA